MGEARPGGSEVLGILLAMSSGHPGSFSTIHASSSAEAFQRLALYAAMGGQTYTPEWIAQLISTAVEKVALDFGKPKQRWIDQMTLAEAKQYLKEGTHFAAGSMGPKISAVVGYLERGGKEAIITTPENMERALAGDGGTHITR